MGEANPEQYCNITRDSPVAGVAAFAFTLGFAPFKDVDCFVASVLCGLCSTWIATRGRGQRIVSAYNAVGTYN